MHPKLVCPTCRTTHRAWPLEPDLRCTNADCATVYRSLGTIPLVIAGDVSDVLVHDDFGPIDVDIIPRLKALKRGSPAWDRIASVGTYLATHLRDEQPYSELAAWVHELLLGEVRSALDLGCGPGRLAVELARRAGASVWALDSSPLCLRWGQAALAQDTIQLARLQTEMRIRVDNIDTREINAAPGGVRWLCGDALAPPFPAHSFDLVAAANLFDSCRDPAFGLRQAVGLVRPGGHLLVATPDAWRISDLPVEAWLADSPEGWAALLQNLGLEIVAQRDGFVYPLERHARQTHVYVMHALLARVPETPMSGIVPDGREL